MEKFIRKYADNVTGIISRSDRLVFRGNLLRLLYNGGMMAFLWAMGVLLKDFAEYASSVSDKLKKAGYEYSDSCPERWYTFPQARPTRNKKLGE